MRVYCEIKPEKFATRMEFVEGSVTPRGVLVHNSLVSPDTLHCYVRFLVWDLKDFMAVKIWVLIVWVMAPRSNVLVVITVSVVAVSCPRLHCKRWSHYIFLKHSYTPTFLYSVTTQKTVWIATGRRCIYIVSICSEFDLRWTTRNVTVAEVWECL